jgi:hypothetical protein
MQTDQPLVLSEVWPRAFSAGLVVAGAFAAVGAIVSLGRGVWPLNATIGGSCLVGLMFILGGLQPRARRWEIGSERAVIDLQPLVGPLRRLEIHPGMIADLSVEEQDWDSRPMTWCVQVTLADGHKFSTPEISTLAEAERIRDRLATFHAGNSG